MSLVLPQAAPRQSFSSRLGAGLGQSISKGLTEGADQAIEFSQQLKKAKYLNDLQRGLLNSGAKARLNLRGGGTGEDLKSDISISPEGEGSIQQGNRQSSNTSIDQPTQNPRGQNQIQGNVDYRKQKLLNPNEIINEAERRAKYMQSQGIPSSPEDEVQYIRQEEQDKKNYKSLQQEYGNMAEKSLTNVLPGATDEQKAFFAKKAEQYIDSNTDESSVKRNLAIDAKNFTNRMSRIEKSIPPRGRLGTKIKDNILGTGRDANKVRNSIRMDIQPLLDEGLYDTARQLLSNAGYYPEEIEGIISELGEGAKKSLAELPDMKKISVPMGVFQKKYSESKDKYSPEQLSDISSAMEKTFKEDPSVNLLLLRKGFEDKGVDWRAFKDTFDNLSMEGKIKLANEDQASFLNNLDEPPLNNLEKILYGLGLRGR